MSSKRSDPQSNLLRTHLRALEDRPEGGERRRNTLQHAAVEFGVPVEKLRSFRDGTDTALNLPGWPQASLAYQNMLRMLAAEGVRWRGAPAASAQIMARCTNPALNLLWNRWATRVSAA